MALPSFLTIYNELISTPTISNVTNEKLDYSNKPLIDKLAQWFADLGLQLTFNLYQILVINLTC